MELNAVSARLLALLEDNRELTGSQLFQQIATELQHPEPDSVVQSGMNLLVDLRDKEIILLTAD